MKRFIKNHGKNNITLDTLQNYPIKCDEMDEIKNDCVRNSIYFKNEDVIRASFGKHISRRKNDEMTNKTFIESVNALLKMFDIKLSMSDRTKIKGKQYSNYMISINNETYDIVKHKIDNSYKPERYSNLF